MSEKSVFECWREKLRIDIGMTKEEALECFQDWRASNKVCNRCEGTKYISFCPVHAICQEADDVRNGVKGNDNGAGTIEAYEHETIRTQIFENRKRDALRPVG